MNWDSFVKHIAPRTALLLCADEEVHDLVETWLMKAGMNVISANDGKNAAGAFLDGPIDYLIFDALPIYLPDLPSLRVQSDPEICVSCMCPRRPTCSMLVLPAFVVRR